MNYQGQPGAHCHMDDRKVCYCWPIEHILGRTPMMFTRRVWKMLNR